MLNCGIVDHWKHLKYRNKLKQKRNCILVTSIEASMLRFRGNRVQLAEGIWTLF